LKLDPEDVIEANLKALRVHSEDFFAYYNLAKAYEFEGRFQEAFLAYQKALALHPQDPYAQFSLGTLCHKLGHREEARLYFQKLISTHPQYVPAHMGLGKLLYEEEKYRECIPRLKRVLSLDPAIHQAQELLSKTYLKIGFYKEALEQIEEAIKQNSSNFSYHSLKGKIMLLLKNLNGAEKSFRNAILLKEDDLNSLLSLGEIRLHLCAPRDSLRYLKSVLEMEPNHPRANLLLGRALVKCSLFDQAEEAFMRVSKINPFEREVALDLASFYADRFEWPKAWIQLKGVPESLKESETYLILLARITRSRRDYPTAIVALESLLERKVYKSEIYHLIGSIHQDQLKLEEAREAFLMALELDENYRPALEDLEELEEQSGNPIEAQKFRSRLESLPLDADPESVSIAEFDYSPSTQEVSQLERLEELERDLRKEPESLEILLELGNLLLEVGELDQALNRFEIALALSAQNPEVLRRLGEVHRQRGELRRSEEYLLQAMEADGQNLEIQLSLVRLQIDSGRFEEARALLGTLRLRFPDSYLPLVFLLRIARYLQDGPEMIRWARDLIGLDKDNVLAHLSLGVLALQSGDLKEARERFLHAVELTSWKDRESLFYLGVTAKNLGHIEEAYRCFAGAVKIQPEDPLSHYNLGVIFRNQGNYHLAEEHLNRAKLYDSEDISILQHLGLLYFEQGEFDQAIGEFLSALSLDSSDFIANFYLGLSFYEQCRYRKAIPYLKVASQSRPTDPTISYHLALCYEEEDKFEPALSCTQCAIANSAEGSKIQAYSRELSRRLESRLYSSKQEFPSVSEDSQTS
jgi:tetratricopeptide (TPR) repeat protein